MDLAGENPFKVRAFEAGARAVLTFPGDLDAALRSGELSRVKGIGKSLAGVIAELLSRGEAALHRELKDKNPPGLLELLRVPGLGPKKARVLFDELHITEPWRTGVCLPGKPPGGAPRLRGQIPGEDQGRSGRTFALRWALPLREISCPWLSPWRPGGGASPASSGSRWPARCAAAWKWPAPLT